MNKQYSAWRILHHQKALAALSNGERLAPINVRLKPTNVCNHHCNYCSYGSGGTLNNTANRDIVGHTDMIPQDKMRELLNDMAVMGVKAVTFSGGGEPLTYPYMLESVASLKRAGIDFALNTNGSLLKDELAEAFYHAKWVRVSFDSPNAREYAGLRRLPIEAFDGVCANIKNFSARKAPECVFGINFVVGKANHSRVYEAAAFLKGLGVDYVKFSALLDNKAHYHREIRDGVIEQLDKARRDLADGQFSIVASYLNECDDQHFAERDFTECYTCHLTTVIGADCKVYVCANRAYNSNSVIGDIAGRSFNEVWFSKETAQKIRQVSHSKDCRYGCIYEARNKLLGQYVNVDLRHMNFI